MADLGLHLHKCQPDLDHNSICLIDLTGQMLKHYKSRQIAHLVPGGDRVFTNVTGRAGHDANHRYLLAIQGKQDCDAQLIPASFQGQPVKLAQGQPINAVAVIYNGRRPVF